MLQLRDEFGTAILLITHDLGVIAEIASRIVVMYAGKVVEEGETLDIFDQPRHPYTQGLLRSIPRMTERSENGRQRLQEIKGVVPSLYHLPIGCSFYPRCSKSSRVCSEEAPELIEIGKLHKVRCHLVSPLF
jgi:oligopeptide/dipeptide ABC transporter ATP-binding protein